MLTLWWQIVPSIVTIDDRGHQQRADGWEARHFTYEVPNHRPGDQDGALEDGGLGYEAHMLSHQCTKHTSDHAN